MAFYSKKNFAISTIASDIASGATSLTVSTGTGSKFPSSGTFPCVIWGAAYTSPDQDPNVEIVLCTSRTGDTLTITRASESTTASAWATSSRIAHTVTAGTLQQYDSISLSGISSNVADKRQQTLHGFSSLPATPTFTGDTFTLPGSTPYTVYHDGVGNLINSDKTVTITSPVVGTQYFIYMQSNLTLAYSTASWDILDLTVIPVCTAYYNASNDYIIGKEFHSAGRNLLNHKEDHDSFGAQYVSGFTTLTIGTGVANNSTNTFSLEGGTFRDEDLYHTISSPQTQLRLGYRDGTNSNKLKFDTAGTAYAKLNAGIPQYDNNGTLTNLTNNNFVVIWLYSTNRSTTPIVGIIGQAQAATVAAAQAQAQPALTGLSVIEWKLLYRIIVKNGAGSLSWQQIDPLYAISTGPAINAGAPTTVAASNVTLISTALSSTNVQSGLEELDTKVQLKAPITNAVLVSPTASAGTDYTVARLRNITLSTSDPTGGSNGDIWIKYVS